MSMNAILFSEGSFYCDGWGNGASPTALGKDIVRTLLQGSEIPEFGWGKGTVTVNYLVNALRYVGRSGQFYDVLDNTSDHDFDPNTPTPGGDWGEVHALRVQAREAEYEARDIRDSEVARHLSPMYAELALELREAADALDPSKQGIRPLRNGLTVPQAKLWDRRVGSNAIWWDGQVFKFGGFYVSPSILGRMIVTTLLRGEEWVQVGDINVTVNYLVQMAREVGKHGEFVDYTDEADWDPNVAPDMTPDAE